MRVQIELAPSLPANPYNSRTIEIDVDDDDIFEAAVERGYVAEWCAENPYAVRTAYQAANAEKMERIAEEIALKRIQEERDEHRSY